MEADPSPPDLMDELLRNLFDPGLSREQATVLRQHLQQSRAQRRRYIRYVTMHSMLESELALQDERLLADLGKWTANPDKGLSDAWVLPAIRPGEQPENLSELEEFDAPGINTDRPARRPSPSRTAAALPQSRNIAAWIRQPSWLVKAAVCVLAIGLPVLIVIRWLSNRPLATIDTVADARWGAAEELPKPGTTLAANRRMVLESGCVELKLTGGAHVILQAPATFQLESGSAISLTSGKLSAVVHGGGFIVHAPGATVVDLGTKFGVEVQENGGAHVEVFEGNVQVQPMSASVANGSAQVISAGQAADVTTGSVAIDENGASPQRFVLALTGGVTQLDVTDLICGGDGTTARRGSAIDTRTGESGAIAQIGSYLGDHQYRRVPLLPAIDGCFVPDGAAGPVQIDSGSDTFTFPAATNKSSQLIWAGGAIPDPPPGNLRMSATLGGIDYGQPGHGFVAMHTNKGLTFDLRAIRRLHPGSRLARFQSLLGNTSLGAAVAPRTSVVILVDGKRRFGKWAFLPSDGPFAVNVPLQETDRFLTLVTLEAGDKIAFNWVLFGDPIISLETNSEHLGG